MQGDAPAFGCVRIDPYFRRASTVEYKSVVTVTVGDWRADERVQGVGSGSG
jgi:hypothetical protein